MLGGSLAGLAMMWTRSGNGLFRNLGVGLIGAFIGDVVFRLVGLLPKLDEISISLRDVVAAFAGYELTMKAYGWAVENRYRFYSYGDAMLIL